MKYKPQELFWGVVNSFFATEPKTFFDCVTYLDLGCYIVLKEFRSHCKPQRISVSYHCYVSIGALLTGFFSTFRNDRIQRVYTNIYGQGLSTSGVHHKYKQLIEFVRELNCTYTRMQSIASRMFTWMSAGMAK